LTDPSAQHRFALCSYTHVSPDWRVGPRALSEHLIYFVTHGALTGTAAGRRVQAEAGGLLWVPPGVRHAFVLSDPLVGMRLYHFRMAVSGDAQNWKHQNTRVLPSAWHLKPAIESLNRERMLTPDELTEARERSLLILIFTSLQRELDRRSERKGGLSHGQVARVLAAASESPDVRLSTEDLARAARLSLDYFRRAFKVTFELSPRSWVVRERVHRMAAELRDGDKAVSDIADAFGYPDLYSMSRQFRRVMGRSPTRYRRE
jgi:AraC-like DNA-binding protein